MPTEEHHLSPESMNTLLGKGLSATLGHEGPFDHESLVLALCAALGLLPKDCPDWKRVVYCSPGLVVILHEVIEVLVKRGVLREEQPEGSTREQHYRLPAPEIRGIVSMPSCADTATYPKIVDLCDCMKNHKTDAPLFQVTTRNGGRSLRVEPLVDTTPYQKDNNHGA